MPPGMPALLGNNELVPYLNLQVLALSPMVTKYWFYGREYGKLDDNIMNACFDNTTFIFKDIFVRLSLSDMHTPEAVSIKRISSFISLTSTG